MSDNVLQEFLVQLGYKVDNNSEQKFTNSLRGAQIQANLLADAITGTMRVVAQGVEQMARNFAALEWSSERTKSSVENLRNFAYAFSQVGGDAKNAGALVESFAAKLRGNPGYGSWLRQMGVTTEGRQSVDEMIDLIDKLQKRYTGSQYGIGAQIAGQFGIDEQSYFQIGKNIGAFRRAQRQGKDIDKALGFDSDAAAKQWRTFMQDINTTSKIVGDIAQKIFTEMEPGIEKALKEFDAWLV